MSKKILKKVTKGLTLLGLTSFVFSQIVTGTSAATASTPTYRQLGVYSINKPAFLNLERLKPNSELSLIVSSFGMSSGQNAVNYLPIVKDTLNSPDKATFTNLSSNIVWPNNSTAVPYNIFNEQLVVVAGGFLTPGNTNGAISIINVTSKQKYDISTVKSGWFYHKVVWKDMDNDGKLDILTARATKPIFGSGKGELLWLKNPGNYNTKWKENIIASGPDVNFDAIDVDNDGNDEIITAGYFSKNLSIYWKDGTQYKSKVLDSKIGSAFDIQFVDINNDGKKDILATNHESSNGSVYAYEIPTNYKTDTWTRHTLLTGIKTLQSGIGQASPGRAIAFYPVKGMTEKPYIIVAGDGSQKAHLLIPNNNNANDWTFTENILLNAKCTVGQIAVDDVNGDGYAEIFVPAYDNNKIYVFTFAP